MNSVIALNVTESSHRFESLAEVCQFFPKCSFRV